MIFLGCLFFIVVIYSDDIWFILNLLIQSVGYYFQYIIAISWHTDAFQQKGNVPDQHATDKDWMHNNTVLYCMYYFLYIIMYIYIAFINVF